VAKNLREKMFQDMEQKEIFKQAQNYAEIIQKQAYTKANTIFPRKYPV
jgi:hypothetical protein